jgi:hypothetical protein
MSKMQFIEMAVTILMWAWCVGAPLLVYLFAPRFVTSLRPKP